MDLKYLQRSVNQTSTYIDLDCKRYRGVVLGEAVSDMQFGITAVIMMGAYCSVLPGRAPSLILEAMTSTCDMPVLLVQ